MANKRQKFKNIIQSKTLEELEEWERDRGPEAHIEPWKLEVVQQVKKEKWKWEVVQQVKKEKRKGWFARHQNQLIVGVILGTVGAVVGGLIVAWITLPWKP